MQTILGETLETGHSGYWHTLSNKPDEALFQSYQEGFFVWTNASGISRDVQLLYRLAAGHPLAGLQRLRIATTDLDGNVEWRGPDLAWAHSRDYLLQALRQHGQLGRPRWGENVHIQLTEREIPGGSEITVTGERIERYQDQTGSWQTDTTPYTDTYQILTVTPQAEQRLLRDWRASGEQALRTAQQFLGTPTAAVYGIHSAEERLTKFARRVAYYFALLPIY